MCMGGGGLFDVPEDERGASTLPKPSVLVSRHQGMTDEIRRPARADDGGR